MFQWTKCCQACDDTIYVFLFLCGFPLDTQILLVSHYYPPPPSLIPRPLHVCVCVCVCLRSHAKGIFSALSCRQARLLCPLCRPLCLLCPVGRPLCLLCPVGRPLCLLCPVCRPLCLLCPIGRLKIALVLFLAMDGHPAGTKTQVADPSLSAVNFM